MDAQAALRTRRSVRFEVRYSAIAFMGGVPLFVLALCMPITSGVVSPPGWLFPVRSWLVPGLAFAATSLVAAYLMRKQISDPKFPFLGAAALTYVVGTALLVPLWGGWI